MKRGTNTGALAPSDLRVFGDSGGDLGLIDRCQVSKISSSLHVTHAFGGGVDDRFVGVAVRDPGATIGIADDVRGNIAEVKGRTPRDAHVISIQARGCIFT